MTKERVALAWRASRAGEVVMEERVALGRAAVHAERLAAWGSR